MNSQYLNDLYNFCCLKTNTHINMLPIYKNNNKYKHIFNRILTTINKTYEAKMKASSTSGYNYTLLYRGEIPHNIIIELKEYLLKYFNKFNIIIINNKDCILDAIFLEYNVYNIYITWNNCNNIIVTDTSIQTDEYIKKYITDDREYNIAVEVAEIIEDNNYDFIDDFELVEN